MSTYRRFFRLRPRADEEMDQELEAHLQLRIDDLVRSGMSAEAAAREARSRFGDFDTARRQLHRAARDRHARLHSRDRLGALWSDARGAFHQLRRARGFAVLAMLTLALGIGVATMMFTLVERILLRPLPFPAAEQLVALTGQDSLHQQVTTVSAADWLDWQRESRTLESTALYTYGSRMALSDESGSRKVSGQRVTADFFRVLGGRFVAGRGFSPDEVEAHAAVAVVSEALWREQLSAATTLGMTLRVDSRPYTVIGVVASADVYPEGTDVWLPRTVRSEGARTNINFLAIARLRPGVSPQEAETDLSRVAQGIRADDPQALYSYGVGVTPLQDALVGDAATYLRLLMGAVVLLLLIVCANVATATLGRGASRSVEMAIRASIGAGRGRLVQQLLVEHLLLALAGGALGMGLAAAGLRAVLAAWGAEIPRSNHVHLDVGVMLFAVGLSLVAGVAAGIVPAFVGSRVSLRQLLASGGRSSTRGNRGVAGAVLVGGEVAVALLLLIGAGLLIRSFQTLLDRNLGFDRGVVTAEITLTGPRYDSDPAQRLAYWDAALTAMRTLPGVTAAGAGNWIPLGFAGTSFVEVEGLERPGAGAGYRVVTDDYFSAMEIPLLRGRVLTQADASGAQRVGVVNRAMVDRYWPDQDPIGKRVRATSMEFSPDGSPAPWITVVGVVDNVRQWGLEAEPEPEMYTSVRQLPFWSRGMTLVVRSDMPAALLMAAVRSRLLGIDPQIPADIGTLDQRLRSQLAPRLLTLSLLTGFAGVALLLAAIGVYGVLAHAVVQRTRELAVRTALGATPGQLIGLVVRWAATIVLPGALVGLVGAFLLTRVLAAMLVEVGPADPWSFAIGMLTLLAVALAAAIIPAWRAARLDPARNLLVQ
ncbi:MAG: ABC transporter permease [Gemmatimonadales bacterium]